MGKFASGVKKEIGGMNSHRIGTVNKTSGLAGQKLIAGRRGTVQHTAPIMKEGLEITKTRNADVATFSTEIKQSPFVK